MAMSLVVFMVYGFMANAFGTRVIGSARVQCRLRFGVAAAVTGLGARLAFSDK